MDLVVIVGLAVEVEVVVLVVVVDELVPVVLLACDLLDFLFDFE